jgi:hypothetical protein
MALSQVIGSAGGVGDPEHAQKFHARKPGDPGCARWDFPLWPGGGGTTPNDRHARIQEVGRGRSTDEPPKAIRPRHG